MGVHICSACRHHSHRAAQLPHATHLHHRPGGAHLRLCLSTARSLRHRHHQQEQGAWPRRADQAERGALRLGRLRKRRQRHHHQDSWQHQRLLLQQERLQDKTAKEGRHALPGRRPLQRQGLGTHQRWRPGPQHHDRPEGEPAHGLGMDTRIPLRQPHHERRIPGHLHAHRKRGAQCRLPTRR